MLRAEQIWDEIPFLSTPSARRATFVLHNGFVRSCISIHALREEGDRPSFFRPIRRL